MTQKDNISICIQDTLHKNKILKLKDCRLWLSSIFKKNSSITIRIVDIKESESLNYNYRDQKKPTNILSFMLSENPVIGDIILCHPVIKDEARNQNKKIQSHYAHLLIHGCLHLLGYSHDKKLDADKMEKKEIQILRKYGFQNPYINS
tara:strand:+ start:137 stop:580 length:444 start_codon:yes stop_codon:yes gene_type:complete